MSWLRNAVRPMASVKRAAASPASSASARRRLGPGSLVASPSAASRNGPGDLDRRGDLGDCQVALDPASDGADDADLDRRAPCTPRPRRPGFGCPSSWREVSPEASRSARGGAHGPRVARHLQRRCQRVDGLAERPERLGAIGRGQQRDPRLGRYRLAGRAVRGGAIGRDEMAGDHPGELLVAEGLEVARRRQMAARVVRASTASHRRPRGRVPGRRRAVRGSARAGRSRRSGSHDGPAGRAEARAMPPSPPRSRPAPRR